MTYNFYAKPKNQDDLIIVTSSPSIHALKFILLDNNKFNNYTLINEPLKEECLVEDHHYYKMLTMGWTHNSKDGWYDEDAIPFSIVINPANFINVVKEFYNKPFKHGKLIGIRNNNSQFRYICEEILGNDIDYIDMYFDRNENWSLTNLVVKEIRTIKYKNSYEN